jgi:hypothetical protein
MTLQDISSFKFSSAHWAVKFCTVQQMETPQTVTLMEQIRPPQMKKIQAPNMHARDVDEATFIKLPWSDIRDTNVESQLHIPAQCAEENLKEEMS